MSTWGQYFKAKNVKTTLHPVKLQGGGIGDDFQTETFPLTIFPISIIAEKVSDLQISKDDFFHFIHFSIKIKNNKIITFTSNFEFITLISLEL